MNLQTKKLKVDLFITPRQNFLPSLYHHPLGRDKLVIPRSKGGRLRTPISKCIALSPRF